MQPHVSQDVHGPYTEAEAKKVQEGAQALVFNAFAAVCVSVIAATLATIFA